MTQPVPITADELGAALSPKHRLFAETYARDPDAQRAAMAAGYVKQNASNQAYRLLLRPDVAAYLQALALMHRSDRIADVAELREFWTGIMRGAGEEMKDRLKASEMLGKSLGTFIEKREHSGNMTIQVVYGDE